MIILWLHLKRKHHFDHNVPSDHMVITFKKWTAQKPVGSLWKKTLVSFTNLSTTYPLWIWATHWDFFHKVLHNIVTMSPAGSSQRNHKEIRLWFSFTTNSQRHQVHSDLLPVWEALKPLNMTLDTLSHRHWGRRAIYPVGTLWVHCGFWNNLPGSYPAGK